MTQDEQNRLNVLKEQGTLNRDQLDEYYLLRLKEDGYIKAEVTPELKVEEVIEETPEEGKKKEEEEIVVPEVAPEGEVVEEKSFKEAVTEETPTE